MMALADIGVSVTGAQASARWWEEKVGFRTTTIAGNEHAVVVAPPGDRFVLHLCQHYEPVEPGNTGVAFLTDELDATVARMREAGVEFTETPKADAPMAKFADPDGNIFWLIGAPRPFIEDTLAQRAPSE